MAERRYPLPLSPVRGPLSPSLAENAVLALGPEAKASRELLDAGRVAPDVLAGMTLLLLAGQPSRAQPANSAAKSERGGQGRGVAGSVWVREHFTVHRPVRVGQMLEVTGAIQRDYSRGGRRYTVTLSETRSATGDLLASNCTTGLVAYRRDEELPDSEEGLDEDAIRRPAIDIGAAAENPAIETLRALRVGDDVRGEVTRVGLEQMRARDGGQSRNPIHTDPEAAKQAGLVLPIVGGSHVFAYLQEALMRALGKQALLHGACFDLRWVAQVRAGTCVEPRARVSAVLEDRVELDLEVGCEGRVAMTGSLAIPLPGT